MQQQITCKLLPSEAASPAVIQHTAAQHLGLPPAAVTGYVIIKQSIDARGKQPWVLMTILAFANEPFHDRTIQKIQLPQVSNAKHRVIIIGAGPAGLFAALQLIEQGIQPILLERGKDVKSRRRDLALLNKEGIINPESNYCFGEGGAGTYSDGKLYTRSTKRGDIGRILNLFVHFGADENILYEAHPHIGTNKLPRIITEMRKRISGCGGEFHFSKKVVDFEIENGMLNGVKTEDGDLFKGDAFILATGHSARDIFMLLDKKNISINAKPFALGVRIEHPQALINNLQYGPLQ